MIRSDKLFLNLYMLAAIVNIYSGAARLEQFEIISKYCLMPFLLLHVISNLKGSFKLFMFLIAGLVFSWFGDIFLIYAGDSDNYFLFGLGSFLLTHLFYIFNFRKLRNDPDGRLQKFWFVIPVIYSGLLLVWLFDGLGDMMVPVVLYACAITAMVIAAMSRYGRTGNYSFLFATSGAGLFVLSDSLIAINKFGNPFEYAAILIMVTYIAAQYLIVGGSLLHRDE